MTSLRLLHEDRDCGRGKPAILEILREVRAGETVLVTSHGEPVATIAPANATRAARAEAKRRLMEDLRAQPTLDLPRIARDELYDE